MKIVLLFICLYLVAAGCAVDQKASAKTAYVWNEVTRQAEFPPGYNYPVFVMDDRMLALNNGGWLSKDGKNWTKTELPESGLNSAYQKFVQFGGAIYALGALRGNYLGFTIDTKILRTKDGKTWETVAEKSNLPTRVFYGAVVFKDKIWLVGGFDGERYYNDIWNSKDGVNWTRIAEKAAWSPRNPSVTVVFKDKIWVLGGGEIDGEKTKWNNPQSEREVWSSTDGVNWTRVAANLNRKWRGAPVVFDDKLWLAGANRGGTFESAVWVSENGADWQEFSAPWSPRGAVAVWVAGDRLFLTGGKSSHVENGETKFVYSNDVWAMSRKTE
jgi:hypothetical protein